MKKLSTIDEYIKSFPVETQEKLKILRNIVREIAPDAIETISYGIPTFKLKSNLVHFAAYKLHLGFYPTPSAIIAFKNELKPYKCSKGAIHFPLDQPLPINLIKKIVKYRISISGI